MLELAAKWWLIERVVGLAILGLVVLGAIVWVLCIWITDLLKHRRRKSKQ